MSILSQKFSGNKPLIASLVMLKLHAFDVNSLDSDFSTPSDSLDQCVFETTVHFARKPISVRATAIEINEYSRITVGH